MSFSFIFQVGTKHTVVIAQNLPEAHASSVLFPILLWSCAKYMTSSLLQASS